MKKISKTVAKTGQFETQYCIDEKNAFDFIKDLPADVEVKEMRWFYRVHSKWNKLAIPESLKKLGVKRITQSNKTDFGEGTFHSVSKEIMLKTLRKIAEWQTVPKDKMIVDKVILVDKGLTEMAFFKRITKNEAVNGNINHTRGRKILAMAKWEPIGKASMKAPEDRIILSKMSATKTHCQVVREVREYRICGGVIQPGSKIVA